MALSRSSIFSSTSSFLSSTTRPLLSSFFKRDISLSTPVLQTLRLLGGIGEGQALRLCHLWGITPQTVWCSLSKDGVERILRALSANRSKIDDKSASKKMMSQWLHLIQIKHYRGLRFCYCLPARGQRTHTNRYTARRLGIQLMRVLASEQHNGTASRVSPSKNIKPKKTRR